MARNVLRRPSRIVAGLVEEDRPMRRAPLGLLGMLALVASVEGFVASRADRLIGFETWAWEHASRAAVAEAASCEILLFGDSQIMMGVVPRVLASEAGPRRPRPAYNLAVPGGQAASSYFLFRKALAAGAKPSIVVVDFMPTLLDCDLSRNAARWPEILGPLDAADLAWSSGDPGLFGSIVSARFVPSLRARPVIREAIGSRLRGESALSRQPNRRRVREEAKRRNIEVNRGALVAAESDRSAIPDDPEEWYANSYPRPWACRPLQESYARRFLDLAESRGIRVCWLVAPMHPEVLALEKCRGDQDRYDRFISAMTNEHPGLVVLDARGAGFESEAFLDLVHLGGSGAVAFTAEVGSILRKQGELPPRIDLGRRRGWDGGPVEDTEGSRAVVRARIGREAPRR